MEACQAMLAWCHALYSVSMGKWDRISTWLTMIRRFCTSQATTLSFTRLMSSRNTLFPARRGLKQSPRLQFQIRHHNCWLIANVELTEVFAQFTTWRTARNTVFSLKNTRLTTNRKNSSVLLSALKIPTATSSLSPVNQISPFIYGSTTSTRCGLRFYWIYLWS